MEDLVKDFPELQLQKPLPSFVEVFFSEVPQNAMLLCKISNDKKEEDLNSPEEDCSFKGDVTGSPLSFCDYSLKCNNTYVNKQWADCEENILPIPFNTARNILSKYLCQATNPNAPVWVVCDGLDLSKTLLLGAFRNENLCSRDVVQYKGQLTFPQIEKLVDECSFPARKGQVLCIFNLQGEDIDCTFNDTQSNLSAYHCSKMSIKLQWQSLRIRAPQNVNSTLLIMDLNIGAKSSPVKFLWTQLNFLSKCHKIMCDIINGQQSTPLCIDYANDQKSVVKKIVHLITNFENAVPIVCKDVKAQVNEHIVSSLTKQVLGCAHPNSDVIDKIWLLLNEFDDLQSIAACLNNVLSDLRNCKSETHANWKKNTLLAKMLEAHFKGDVFITEISISKAVEIMLQTGIEKLKHDYIYVFSNMDIECLSYFKDFTPSIYDCPEIAKHNLNVLTKLHIALDFIWGALSHFDLKKQKLNTFTRYIVKECLEKKYLFDDLQDNTVVSLEVPMNYETVAGYLQGDFSTLKLKVFSEEDDDYSILLLTSQSVFPPKLMQCEENILEERKEDEEETVEGKGDTTLIETKYFVYELSHCSDFL